MNDDVDRLLTEAGARWRADQPAPPEPDLSRLDAHRARRWPAIAAAAAGVAVVASGAVILAGNPHSRPSPGSAVAGGDATAVDPATLVVHDGDLVEATGQVIAAPGKPVVYCAPHAETAIGYLPGHEPAPTCQEGLAVTLVGVDLDRLSDARTVKGVRVGQATLRGTWQERTITVTEQSPPGHPQYRSTGPPEKPPCAAPPGGWQPGELSGLDALDGYLNQHPDRFGGLWIGWPDGYPSGPTDGPDYAGRTQVAVVEVVTGDLEAAQRELAAIFAGNLCVARGRITLAEAARVRMLVERLMDDRGTGISSAGGAGQYGVTVQLTVLDERLYGAFARIGLDALDLQPAVRPVGR